ncbi:MAG: aminotransferase class III-fold pyridoxal phosphate-dependent enzyme [Alphaproteobacteria bacterium]|jgi:adenosylmethionine-8-amino-7-oxononanoate aminotransferase|nr:aminotransferase class III-fold pyridoxal phosphate-dependent enzyme [Alphaproteobacteria bacterium]MDP6563458.1 aminotransferase class III-fold pyridoxal phosphate-dependent enzyme [Alphaproteobacteria bacterium]
MEETSGRQAVATPGGTQDIYYACPAAVPLPMIERASGVYMWDDAGNEYIDASSGPLVSAIGHGNARVIDAMAAQARTLDYAYSRVARNRPNLDYAERLAELAGPGFERVSFASGGSEAVDNALKFLRQYAIATGQARRRRVISLMPSYHGATIATLAIGGNEGLAAFMEDFAVVADTVPAPLSYRLSGNHTQDSHAAECAGALEAKIRELGPENVLALVIEPIGGLSTGAVVPPARYFHDIREICNRHGVYLVFDEILCGAGRSGRFFTAHHWPDALPDIIVMAKGLAAGYSPLGAMLAPAAMVDELAGLSGCEFTYSYNANPVSCAAGAAVLDEFERLGLVERARTMGATLRAGLDAIMERSPILGDVRGIGLLLAVEMVADKASKEMLPDNCLPTERIRVHGLENGVLLYSRPTAGSRLGHWFMVAPPLTIGAAECQELLRRTEAAVGAFHRELVSAGVV